MAIERKYSKSKTAELATLASRHANDRVVLKQLQDELAYRERPAARRLLEQVKKQLAVLSRQPIPSPFAPASAPAVELAPTPTPTPTPAPNPEPQILAVKVDYTSAGGTPPPEPTSNRACAPVPLPPKSDAVQEPLVQRQRHTDPTAVLTCWIALETLSPATYRREQTLVQDPRDVARLQGPTMPWERGEKSRPKFQLYYEVPLAAIDMEAASKALMADFGAGEDQLPRLREQALVASVMVTRTGTVLEVNRPGFRGGCLV